MKVILISTSILGQKVSYLIKPDFVTFIALFGIIFVFFALFTLKSVLILALFAFCKRVSYKLVSYAKKAHVPVYCKEPPSPSVYMPAQTKKPDGFVRDHVHCRI